ncbi:hypothetical protein [uncultured Maribacter sp.]|uniref:hypothetical protein n=1 Tax=uncultured Maribacter sp. TaxID=431308 RepID=UPI00263A1881|nr:hypothetical protein [uncultured Maribacter sp.]
MLLEQKTQEIDKNTLQIENAVVRIDRSYKNILQLKNKLNSYSYEPRTYSLYQQLEELKLKLELISVSHLKLMNTLKKPVHFIESQIQLVKENLEAVHVIEQDVSDYISLAK